MAGQKRGMTPRLKRQLKRRNAIEPVIGHLKSDGRLDRNYLKGTLGDSMNALLVGAGHNIRLLLRKLRLFFVPVSGGFGPADTPRPCVAA